MRRLGVVAFCALLLVPAAAAAPKTSLTQQRATAIFLANPKVAKWLRHFPPKTRTTEATYSAVYENWTIKVWTSIDKVGEVATGRVQDTNGVVTEAWTGPQVAWKMARGYKGAFGGKEINSLPIWLGFCAAFLIGLADFRRPLSLRNLDLLALVSFSVSLWYFNKGHVFTAMPLVYPPLVYLLGRMVWSVRRGHGVTVTRSVWPVWLLAAAAIFLVGFRIGLNVENSNVIDVGYSGVVGAERISSGESPYGNFPVEDSLKACGSTDEDGEIRDRIQTNGRCESANPQGDTYGPVAYEAYLPAYWLFGWSGKWDSLPAAHAATIAFDLLCLLGLALVGLRFGGLSLAVTLAFAWAAWPFTQYVSSSNTNDALPPLFLIWGFWLVTSSFARGAFSALAGWTKFAPLLVAGLARASAREARLPRRIPGRDGGGFLDPVARAEPAARRSRLLRPDGQVPDRPAFALLDLGLEAIRRGLPGPASGPAGAAGAARRRRDRRLLRTETEDSAAARGAHRSSAARLRARADALVLPLFALVLPLRRVCGPDGRARDGSRRGPRTE
jgi:hypothetical protein